MCCFSCIPHISILSPHSGAATSSSPCSVPNISTSETDTTTLLPPRPHSLTPCLCIRYPLTLPCNPLLSHHSALKNAAMKAHTRKLLFRGDRDGNGNTLAYPPDPFPPPINASSSSSGLRRPFDSSMALTVIVLLTALFFMGFFSVYIRRFADDSAVEISRRRRHQQQPASSSSRSPSSAKGLDPSTLSSLPLFTYRGDPVEIMDCPVCLSEFEDKDTVKIIPYCRHVFHPSCIDTWLSSHVSCPVCRSTQFFPAKVREASDLGLRESEERSAVENGGSLGVRRTSSCSSLGERALLQRTFSF